MRERHKRPTRVGGSVPNATIAVQLTIEEWVAEGKKLGNLVLERVHMLEDHKDRKKKMADQVKALDQRIAEMAQTAATGKQQRAPGPRKETSE
jgi:hypothetical protein